MSEKIGRTDLNKLLNSVDKMFKNENMKEHLRETKNGFIDISVSEKRYEVEGIHLSIVKLKDLPVYYIKYKDDKEDYHLGFDSKMMTESEKGTIKKFNDIVVSLNLKVNPIVLKGVDVKI